MHHLGHPLKDLESTCHCLHLYHPPKHIVFHMTFNKEIIEYNISLRLIASSGYCIHVVSELSTCMQTTIAVTKIGSIQLTLTKYTLTKYTEFHTKEQHGAHIPWAAPCYVSSHWVEFTHILSKDLLQRRNRWGRGGVKSLKSRNGNHHQQMTSNVQLMQGSIDTETHCFKKREIYVLSVLQESPYNTYVGMVAIFYSLFSNGSDQLKLSWIVNLKHPRWRICL